MDTKILRHKILDLAIHGRLVPQDANDEPASALLARIRAEKEQLVADGKLKKKDLASTPVSDEDKPFEVPKGWEWCRLGEIFMFIRNGKSIKQSKDASGIPITRIETISNCDINRERMGYANIFDVSGYEDYLLKNGDILMSHINSPIHVGKSALCKDLKENEKIIHGMNLLCLRAYSTLFPSYIEKYFNSNVFKELIRPYVQNAVNQASINTKVIGSTLIPLPPLAEQQRIVAAVEQWTSLVDIIESRKENLQQSIALAKNKILDLAIKGKLVEKEGKWEEKTLGEVATYINGRAFKPTEWEDAGKPIIRIQNLNDPEAKYNYSSHEHEEKYLVHKGDLLFAWAASLGTYIWDGGDAWLNQHIFKVIPHAFINKKYLNIALDAMIASLYERSHGSGMVHITKAEFVKTPILVPPLSEQHRIAAKVEELFTQLDNIANALK